MTFVLFLLSSCEDSDSSGSDSGSTPDIAASVVPTELLNEVESLSEEKGSLSDVAANLLDKSGLGSDALKAGSDALEAGSDILSGVKEKISSIGVELMDAAED